MAPSTPSTKDETASPEAPKQTLPVGHPQAAYVSPDMTFRDGGGESLPESEQQHVDNLKQATEDEAAAAAEHEDKVAKEEQEAAAKEAEAAAKADAKSAA